MNLYLPTYIFKLRYTLSLYMFLARVHNMNTCTERRISVIDRILTTFGKLLAVYTSSCCSNLIQYRDALNDFLQKRLVERHVNDSIKFRSLYDVVGFYLHLIFPYGTYLTKYQETYFLALCSVW